MTHFLNVFEHYSVFLKPLLFNSISSSFFSLVSEFIFKAGKQEEDCIKKHVIYEQQRQLESQKGLFER